MKEKIMTIYQTNEGVILEIELKTIDPEEVDRVINEIRRFIPKG
jgi:hypothetical protein